MSGLRCICLAWILVIAASCASVPERPLEPAESAEMQALEAFARVYGYVRWFYPGDEAAKVDWDRFAVEGARRMLLVHEASDLGPALEALFAPVAFNLRLYTEGGQRPVTPLPAETSGLKVVAWQHYGAGLGQIDSFYKSLRLNRDGAQADPGSGNVSQALDAAPYRGMRIKLRAALRMERKEDGDGSRAHLYLNVVGPGPRLIFSDKMEDRPVREPEWKVYECEGTVAEEAVTISFGAFIRGRGELWADSFELLVAPAGSGDWRPIAIANAGFEAHPDKPESWLSLSRVHRYAVDPKRAHQGLRSLSIAAPPSVRGPLFEAHADPGEVVDEAIAPGLRMRMPLALYSDAIGTQPRDSAAPTVPSLDRAKAVDAGAESVRLAAAIVAWNTYRYFYPYFDVVDVDWAARLRPLLRDAREARDGLEMLTVLQKLVAATQDGHGNVFWSAQPKEGYPPFRAEWIEDRAVVTRSLDESRFRIGDVILAIDAQSSNAMIAADEERISGSPQWRRVRAMLRFGAGAQQQSREFSVQRGDQRIQVQAVLDQTVPMSPAPRPAIEEVRPGIWYVDLRNAPIESVQGRMAVLAQAHGLVFDLRGYPKNPGDATVLRHLLSAPENVDWMLVPRISRPESGQRDYEWIGWCLRPEQPRLGGRIAFLTDGSAISAAESVMAYVEGSQLATIVGSATAGANGAIRSALLPGGFGIVFTGTRVLKHDGTRLHGIGVLPTLPASPTVAGVVAGRDEVLEAGLAIVDRPWDADHQPTSMIPAP